MAHALRAPNPSRHPIKKRYAVIEQFD